MGIAIACVVLAASNASPPAQPAAVAEQTALPATRDVAEIGGRMRQLFTDWSLAPTIEESPDRFSARLDASPKEIAGGRYIIERRRSRHRKRTITTNVAARRGFALEVSWMPMLTAVLDRIAPLQPVTP